MTAATSPSASDGPSPGGAVALAFGLVLGLLAGGIAFYYVVESLHLVPPAYGLWLRIAFVAALGYLAVLIVGRILLATAVRWTGRKHAGLIHSAYRLVAYVVLALAILYAAGINGYALLAGGTFAGLVLGLASQTALANFIAGIILLIARPFEPGDRITLVSSQYSFLLPSYPPKFYSQDLLMPGFTGIVDDVGIVFTSLRTDEGPSVKLPNSLVISAAVVGHSLPERWVRVKYEIPPTILPETLLPLLTEAVKQNEWVIQPERVRAYVNQATQSSYAVSIDALCRGSLEEPPRSALYIDIMRVVRDATPKAPAIEEPTTLPL